MSLISRTRMRSTANYMRSDLNRHPERGLQNSSVPKTRHRQQMRVSGIDTAISPVATPKPSSAGTLALDPVSQAVVTPAAHTSYSFRSRTPPSGEATADDESPRDTVSSDSTHKDNTSRQ